MSDNNHATITPELLEVRDSKTGKEIPLPDFWLELALMLSNYKTITNQLIEHNADILPEREQTMFGTKWARDNVELPVSPSELFPETYIDKSNTLYILQHNAVQKILPYRKSKKLVEFIETLGLWDSNWQEIKNLYGEYAIRAKSSV